MNNHFNLRRFGLLFRKHTVEHYKSYLMSFMVLVGIMTLVMGYITYATGKLDAGLQDLFFMLFMVGAGSIFASSVFSDLGDNKKAIAFLTLPASTLEKYVVAWVYSFPIYLLLYIPAFYLVASTLNSIAHEQSNLLKLFGPSGNVDKVIFLYAFLHAACLVGAVYFRKVHFIKTIFILFLGFFVILVLNRWMLQAMLGIEDVSAVPLSNVSFVENNQLYTLGVTDAELSFTWIISFGFLLIVWAISYFKLKEKQV